MTKKGMSRRDFLKGAAAGAVSLTALGVLGACSPAEAATTTETAAAAAPETTPAATAAPETAAVPETTAAAASGEPSAYDLSIQMSQGNRGQDPAKKAPTTPEEYIEISGEGFAMAAAVAAMVPAVGIKPEDFMLNKPAWLGDAPVITDIAYEEDCDVLVIGSGEAGTTAALRAAELGANVLCLEMQTWDEYDNFACDMATYNNRLFLERGGDKFRYDTMEVFNEYMRKATGHANPSLLKGYAERSGEMMDWALQYIPQEYIDKYAHTVNCPRGNEGFSGESNKQLYFAAMLQWRDDESNLNMWPFVIRSLMNALEEKGGRHIYGAQAHVLVQNENGDVVGCIAQDIDGKYFKVNCKAVINAAGDFGGNPDMRLDLSDQLRNLAWSVGMDRTDASNTGGMGRDGSGIKMCLWAGATMEAGPRASMGGAINGKPGFAFGGCWPCFGPDGKRFFNESQIKYGTTAVCDMIPSGSLIACVTDAKWDQVCEYQGYGHEVMDRSNEHMIRTVREHMANYKTGPDGFKVQAFAKYGAEFDTVYAADTLEELGQIMGYEGEALQGFLDEIAHWNEMCRNKKDTDWGFDPQLMFPIDTAPFFGSYTVTTIAPPSGGLVQLAGVNTDGRYQVLRADKTPIKGLYAVGNVCGNRYAVQYSTPTSGNSCGMALTNGYIAAEHVVEDIR